MVQFTDVYVKDVTELSDGEVTLLGHIVSALSLTSMIPASDMRDAMQSFPCVRQIMMQFSVVSAAIQLLWPPNLVVAELGKRELNPQGPHAGQSWKAIEDLVVTEDE